MKYRYYELNAILNKHNEIAYLSVIEIKSMRQGLILRRMVRLLEYAFRTCDFHNVTFSYNKRNR